MRIVILYNTSWYVYLLRRNLIAELIRVGCEVFVVAPIDNYTDRVIQLGVKHVNLPLDPASKNPFSELRCIKTLHRILAQLKPDAVLSFTIKCNLYAGLCKRVVPFVQIANVSGLGSAFQSGGATLLITRTLYRLAMQNTDRILFQNRDDLAQCLEHVLVPSDRSSLIPGSGVDLRAFRPSPRAGSAPRTFLMFGRLLPQKGFDLLLAAATRLRAEYRDRIAIWILGKPDHERSESIALYHRINHAHGDGTIRYLHSTDDVRPILRESDIVVLPSTYNEGIPRSLLEALACGKAIITTDWRGCRETVIHGENGYLIRPHSEAALIDAMDQMMRLNDSELARFGAASRKRAERLFDERLVLDAYLNALGLSQPCERRASN